MLESTSIVGLFYPFHSFIIPRGCVGGYLNFFFFCFLCFDASLLPVYAASDLLHFFFVFGFVPLSRDETREVGRVLIAFSNLSPLGHR